eukprot:jgi/Mesen1/2533/ME000161S01597
MSFSAVSLLLLKIPGGACTLPGFQASGLSAITAQALLLSAGGTAVSAPPVGDHARWHIEVTHGRTSREAASHQQQSISKLVLVLTLALLCRWRGLHTDDNNNNLMPLAFSVRLQGLKEATKRGRRRQEQQTTWTGMLSNGAARTRAEPAWLINRCEASRRRAEAGHARCVKRQMRVFPARDTGYSRDEKEAAKTNKTTKTKEKTAKTEKTTTIFAKAMMSSKTTATMQAAGGHVPFLGWRPS